MKVLVACEFSGVVRDAFLKRGHMAMSCDLLPTDTEDWQHHIQCDALKAVYLDNWDLMIAHPPCTHLAASGARWWKDKRQEQEDAVSFVRKLMNASIPRICIENPIGALSRLIRKPDQIIQPWMFGHRESKATCLWLRGLPKLRTGAIKDPDTYACRKCGARFPAALGEYGCVCGEGPARLVYENQTPTGQNRLSSSRAKERAVTYQGIAEAMADQWGGE